MEMVTVDYMNRMVCAAFFTGIAFAAFIILLAFGIDYLEGKIMGRKKKGSTYIFINGKGYSDDE